MRFYKERRKVEFARKACNLNLYLTNKLETVII